MGSKGCDIGRQLKNVIDRLNAAAARRPSHLQGVEPRLVAVSKTKPASLILEAYSCGQHHFGENYVQELEEKSKDPELLETCSELKWHFIGNLQRNKVNKITGVPNLFMVETIESEKLATALNNSWGKQGHSEPLRILIQINTSGEENKGGVEPSGASSLALFIRDKCPNLKLAGLMTIGAYECSTNEAVNPDFQCLVKCRKEVAGALGVEELELELSMGMSHDFEHAIEVGSTNVRVGSTIFGAREYQPKANLTPTSAAQEQNASSTESKATSSKQGNSKDRMEATEKCMENLSLATS